MKKQCTKCLIYKDYSAFSKNKRTKTGLQCWCKDCVNQYSKAISNNPVYVGQKQCQTCNTVKDRMCFHVNKRNKDGLENRCKECNILRKDKNHYKKKYGITLDQYNKILEKQGNKCAICRTDNPGSRINRFHVDHDHKTLEVRGLLCENCNRALGQFMDNVDILNSAIEYLKKENNKTLVLNNKTIIIWRWEDAPQSYRDLSTNGGDEDWVAFVPDDFLNNHYIPSWLDEGSSFGCCSVEEHNVDGGKVLIGSHA